jgi:Galactose oxidase, central domain
VPQMDPLSVEKFLPYSNRYNAGFFGGIQSVGLGQTKSACPTCDLRICKVCNLPVDMKELIIHPETQKIYAQSSQGITEITASFSLAARKAIFDSRSRWLVAAERGGWLTSKSIVFATLSTDGTSVKSVLALKDGAVREINLADFSSALTEVKRQDSSFPPPRSDFGAVLSDIERTIFLFGGKFPSGRLANDLWLFDIGTNRWHQFHVTGPAPKIVLAATYAPETRSLWLVDEGYGNVRSARLIRYDIETGKFNVIGEWSRTPSIDRVEISEAPYGDVLLTGSSSVNNRVVGVLLHPNGNRVTVTGAFRREGKLAIEPTLSETGLALPLVSDGETGVDHVVIPADEILFESKKKRGREQIPPRIGIDQCL